MRFKVDIINYRQCIPEYLCLIIIYLSFLSFTDHIGQYANFIRIGCSFILWIYLFMTKCIKKVEIIFVALLFVYDLMFLLIGKGSIQTFLLFLPVALYILTAKSLKSQYWKIIPVFIVVDLLIAWINSPNNYLLYQGMSRNYVSVFILYSLIIYVIYLDKNKQKINLMYILLSWTFSIYTVGRGGIITFSVILILFIIQRFLENNQDKINKFKIIKMVFFCVAFFILSVLAIENIEFIKMAFLGRFFGSEASAYASTMERIYFLKEYIRECENSFSSFIFGGDANLISYIDGNMHNSYFQVHSKFGLLGLCFVLIGSVKSLLFMVKNNKWQYVFIFLGFLLRAGTDWCFPGFPMDFILLYFILYPYLDIENRRNKA